MPDATLIVAPHLDVTAIDGRGIVVVADERHTFYAGAAHAALVRAAERSGAHDLLAAVSGQVPVEAARDALAELRAARVLVATGARDAEAAWWSRTRTQPTAATVALRPVGGVDPVPVTSALQATGIAVTPTGGDLEVVLVTDYLDPELEAVNTDALDSSRPWLLAAPQSAQVWVGPLFVPHRGPCWECLAQRLRRHRRIDEFLRDEGGRSTPVVRHQGALHATRLAAAGIVATTLAQWLARGVGGPIVGDTVLSVETTDWSSERHRVIWRPQCPACGEPGAPVAAAARAPRLAEPGELSTPAALRSVRPEATWERLSHHVSPISGVVGQVVPWGDAPWPQQVFGADDGGDVIVRGEGRWELPEQRTSGGKGTSATQAKVSALCEAIERYCGDYSGEEPRRRTTLDALGDAGIHPNTCLHYSDEQYARRDSLNVEAESRRARVPEPFDPAMKMDWSPLWSLFEGRERLLPTAYCYYRAPHPDPGFHANSNGCAAGNTIEEAILHGLLELIERDHAALWWYNRLRLPAIDLDSLDSAWLAEVRAQFAASGRELWALDLTADLGIPVVAAFAPSLPDPSVAAVGFGADLDGPRAVVRAVTEMLQVQWFDAPGPGRSLHTVGADEAPHLQPDPDRPQRLGPDLPALDTGDLREDLDTCLDAVRAAAIDVLVLDQTRPDVGVPVVRVVAPELRHFWPRFAPGRLYDVPVALGLLDRPRGESELIPVPPGP